MKKIKLPGAASLRAIGAMIAVAILVVGVLGWKMSVAHAAPTYSISGTVTFGGNPVPSSARLDVSYSGPNGYGSTTADSLGNYTVSGLPEGTYAATLRYISRTSGVPSFNIGPDISIAVSGGNVAQDFSFADLATVTVNVKDANGNPVPGSQAILSSTGNPNITTTTEGMTFYAYSGSVVSRGTAGGSGTVALKVFRGGTYSVCAYPDSAGLRRYCTSDITVNSDMSVTVYLASIPSAPSNLAAPSPTKAPVLTWNSSAGATSYNIYRDGVNIATKTATGYTDTTAAEGAHSYYVTAVNVVGESSQSDAISVLVDKTRPAASIASPSSFATPFSEGPNVTFVASDSSGLQIMVIHVYSSSGQLLGICGTATPAQLAAGSMSCNLSSLPSGTYYIRAGANNNAGNNQTVNSGNFVIL